MNKFFAIVLLIFIVNPAIAADKEVIDKKTSQKYITAATTSNNRVKRVKNEWRDTRKLIKNAKKAHKNKDYKKSIFYSKKALNEAKMAMEQYKKQKDSYRFIE